MQTDNKKTAQRIAREKMLADPVKAATDRENRRLAQQEYISRQRAAGIKPHKVMLTDDEWEQVQALIAELQKNRT